MVTESPFMYTPAISDSLSSLVDSECFDTVGGFGTVLKDMNTMMYTPYLPDDDSGSKDYPRWGYIVILPKSTTLDDVEKFYRDYIFRIYNKHKSIELKHLHFVTNGFHNPDGDFMYHAFRRLGQIVDYYSSTDNQSNEEKINEIRAMVREYDIQRIYQENKDSYEISYSDDTDLKIIKTYGEYGILPSEIITIDYKSNEAIRFVDEESRKKYLETVSWLKYEDYKNE